MMSKEMHGVKPCLSKGQTCFSKFSGRNKITAQIAQRFGDPTRAGRRPAKFPLVIIALTAVIGFSFVACDEGKGVEWGDWVETKKPTLITEGEEKRTDKNNSSNTETRVKARLITNTALWEEALSMISEKTGGAYTLTIGGNVGVPGSNPSRFGTTEAENSLSVTLKGNGKLFLTSQGRLFYIDARQTLIIDSEGLTLQGLKNGQNGATQDNNQSLVEVGLDGTLELKKGAISGNTYSNFRGGGVYVSGRGTFTMHGGEISGNTATEGGGVHINSGGTFTMNGGKISGNTATSNQTDYGGGGVCIRAGTFIMKGGEISGNTATRNGGGVYLTGNSGPPASMGTFRIVNGIIYGSNEPTSLKNTATYNGAALGTGSYFYSYRGNDDVNLSGSDDTIRVRNGESY